MFILVPTLNNWHWSIMFFLPKTYSLKRKEIVQTVIYITSHTHQNMTPSFWVGCISSSWWAVAIDQQSPTLQTSRTTGWRLLLDSPRGQVVPYLGCSPKESALLSSWQNPEEERRQTRTSSVGWHLTLHVSSGHFIVNSSQLWFTFILGGRGTTSEE